MSDWTACFSMEKGETYRVKFVRYGRSVVQEGSFTFHGEKLEGNIAVMVALDERNACGLINILSIDKQEAKANAREL